MRETEITVQVYAELDDIFAKLKQLGFQPVGQCTLHDRYFTHLTTEPVRDYPELMQNSFLVRAVSGDKAEAKLCYKDKTIDAAGRVVSEEKITVPLDNLADTLKIFHCAHLNCWCELKQDLYVYRRDQIEFAVQAVGDLGNFIEYEEDATMAGLTPAQKMATMHDQLKGLGLPLGTDLSCKKAYLQYLRTKSRTKQ